MALTHTPPPIQDPMGTQRWLDWFYKINAVLDRALTVANWSDLDFSGSNITDIVTRKHNDLQSLQGGTAAEYYHLTAQQNTDVGNGVSGTFVSNDTPNKTITVSNGIITSIV